MAVVGAGLNEGEFDGGAEGAPAIEDLVSEEEAEAGADAYAGEEVPGASGELGIGFRVVATGFAVEGEVHEVVEGD